MQKIRVPQHLLIDRIRRALAKEGATVRQRNVNKRFCDAPGDILIVRVSPSPCPPMHPRDEHNRLAQPYPGTLEELGRELGVLDEHEELVP